MIAQELVTAGASFAGEDGEVRHVYSINRLGNGYCVLWDSQPRPGSTFAVMFWYQAQRSRPHGMMQMRKFQRWAMSIVAPAAQGAQGEDNQRRGGDL